MEPADGNCCAFSTFSGQLPSLTGLPLKQLNQLNRIRQRVPPSPPKAFQPKYNQSTIFRSRVIQNLIIQTQALTLLWICIYTHCIERIHLLPV